MNETLNSSPAFCLVFPRRRWLCVTFAAGPQISPDTTRVMEGLVTGGHMALCSSTHGLPKLSKGPGEVKNTELQTSQRRAQKTPLLPTCN